MAEAMNRLLQAIRLQRDAFVWMDFNDRATADGLVFVVVTRLLLLAGFGGSILGLATRGLSGWEVLFRSMLNGIIFWLVYSGLAYAVARFGLQAGGKYPVYLRITGFAYPTLLLLIFTRLLALPGILAFLIGSVWFLAVVTRGITYESDLSTERAAIAAGGGLIAWIIVSEILRWGLV